MLLFILCVSNSNRSVPWILSGDFVSTDYVQTHNDFDGSTKIYWDPYTNRNSVNDEQNATYSRTIFNNLNMNDDTYNVNDITFMYIGNGYDYKHTTFSEVKSQNGDCAYKHHDMLKRFNNLETEMPIDKDYFLRYEATGSLSIALGKDYSRISNPSFSYVSVDLFDENLRIDEFVNGTISETVTTYNPNFFVVSNRHVQFVLEDEDIDLENTKGKRNMTIKYAMVQQWNDFVKNVTENKNDNKPTNTIILMSAGDYGSLPIDILESSLMYHQKTLTIGATSFSSAVAWYSQWSDALFACAPGGGSDTLTDGMHRMMPVVKVARPNNTKLNDSLNDIHNKSRPSIGSNIAVSVFASASAVVAKKFKDIGLTFDFRDLLYMTALTADIVDPEHQLWHQNAANIWFNPAYGYGQINLNKMLDETLIKEMKRIKGKPVTYSRKFEKLLNNPHDTHKDYTFLYFGEEDVPGFKFEFDERARVETISFTFNIENFYISDLEIKLTSPSNSSYIIKNHGIGVSFKDKDYGTLPLPDNKFVVMTRRFFGEQLNGTWIASFRQKTYTPMNKIWGVMMTVNCSTSTEPINKLANQEKFDKVTPFSHNNSPQKISIDNIDNIKCMNEYTAHFDASAFAGAVKENTTGKGANVFLSFYLRHPEDHRLFRLNSNDVKLTEDDIKNGNIINYYFKVPCLLENNSEIILGARHPLLNKTVESPKFKVINNRDKYRINKIKPYETFHEEEVNFEFTYNEKHLPRFGNTQSCHATIYDLNSMNRIFSWSFTNYGNLKINFSKIGMETISQGVLTISLYESDKDCPNIYLPFRYIKNSTFVEKYHNIKPESNFSLSWIKSKQNKECSYDYLQISDESARQVMLIKTFDKSDLGVIGIVVPSVLLVIVGLIVIFTKHMIDVKPKKSDIKSSSSN